MTALSFPPLFHGLAVEGALDPMEKAQAEALRGCDAGLVTYGVGGDTLRAAIVFTPETPLSEAMTILPVCGVGFQNAMGALAPPEVAVHLEWAGGIRINGAGAGHFAVASATQNADDIPDWLIVGLTLRLWPKDADTGHTPDETALYAEGCADVDAGGLIEAWVRHTLVGINRWMAEGTAAVHADWRGLAHGIGEPVRQAGLDGVFLGVDENFGMLLRDAETTHLVPLTALLEEEA